MVRWWSMGPCRCSTRASVIVPVTSWRMAHTAWVTSSRLGVSSGLVASRPSHPRSRGACRGWRARGLATACLVSSQARTAAVAIGGSSTGGVRASLLVPPSHRGVLQRPARKNDVLHPVKCPISAI